MEDAPTRPLARQDGLARSGGTKASDSDAGGAGSASRAGAAAEASDTDPYGAGAASRAGAAAEASDTDAGGAGAASRASAAPETGRRTGGRRYRTGPPAPQVRPAYDRPRAQTTPFPAGFGAWATLAVLFAGCLASCLLAAWVHLVVVAGLGFCAGSGLAAWYCRPTALLRMVIAIPAVFAGAETVAQLALLQRGGHHGLVLPVAGGTLLTLAAVAPWLFAGTAGAIAIALFRGLPGCIRDLRAELRGRAPARQAPRASRPAQVRQTPQARQPPRADRRD